MEKDKKLKPYKELSKKQQERVSELIQKIEALNEVVEKKVSEARTEASKLSDELDWDNPYDYQFVDEIDSCLRFFGKDMKLF
jgi:NH3-dependent NAD+ synthetase